MNSVHNFNFGTVDIVAVNFECLVCAVRSVVVLAVAIFSDAAESYIPLFKRTLLCLVLKPCRVRFDILPICTIVP